MPDPRLKDRQMTCGDEQCKSQWHRKKCRQWNRKNRDYFRANYLQNKLHRAADTPAISRSRVPAARFKTGLPQEVVQEVIGIQPVVILQYFAQLLNRRFQELIARQVFVNTS
jgi:transposase